MTHVIESKNSIPVTIQDFSFDVTLTQERLEGVIDAIIIDIHQVAQLHAFFTKWLKENGE